jgi:tRNA uridine 5-carboxymethylaminomethyl modification enzyme
MYDVIVVGGGHAGIEASHIAAKMGKNTLLITGNIKNIGDMPCNPSIGGTAKGIIVREVDALGGLMGRIADISHIQIKMLNNSKGPAVRSLRAQADKVTYPKNMQEYLMKMPNLTIKESLVEDLIIENNIVKGIITENNEKIEGKTVVLTTGTYLCGNILVGSKNTPGGPHGERRSNYLSTKLKEYGLKIIRLKTGTPQRIKKDSIDFSVMSEEHGDSTYWAFSNDFGPTYKIEDQKSCYLLYTNELTHQIIRENLSKSAMYGGYATGVGPRYCPSIEDKIVRFADKERHQLFLEPESLYYDDWYLQGFSTSMPEDVQEKMVHSLHGLENAVITKYAYAIEYDAIDPLQIKPTLENKVLENLFTAGQINGTSGYEEAAGQGIIAGINAVLKVDNKEPLILKRSDAYIGVLIDDLVTKGTIEPYRMLTSRAEFRLILRHDNADLRLRHYAHDIGTINEDQYNRLIEKEEKIKELTKYLQENTLHLTEDVIKVFESNNINVPLTGLNYYDLLKRPEITMKFIENFIEINYLNEVKEQVEINAKYDGYIKKAYKEVEKLSRLEEKQIPEDIDLSNMNYKIEDEDTIININNNKVTLYNFNLKNFIEKDD